MDAYRPRRRDDPRRRSILPPEPHLRGTSDEDFEPNQRAQHRQPALSYRDGKGKRPLEDDADVQEAVPAQKSSADLFQLIKAIVGAEIDRLGTIYYGDQAYIMDIFKGVLEEYVIEVEQFLKSGRSHWAAAEQAPKRQKKSLAPNPTNLAAKDKLRKLQKIVNKLNEEEQAWESVLEQLEDGTAITADVPMALPAHVNLDMSANSEASAVVRDCAAAFESLSKECEQLSDTMDSIARVEKCASKLANRVATHVRVKTFRTQKNFADPKTIIRGVSNK